MPDAVPLALAQSCERVTHIDKKEDASLLRAHLVKIINFQFPVRFEKFFSFLSKIELTINKRGTLHDAPNQVEYREGVRASKTYV